jgi:hypothetical protein
LHIFALFWIKKRPFFANFFGEYSLKIITWVPGSPIESFFLPRLKVNCNLSSTQLRARVNPDRVRGPWFHTSPWGWLCMSCFACRTHRNLRTRRRMSCKKSTASLVKQCKLKEGVVPADGLGCLLLKLRFCIY